MSRSIHNNVFLDHESQQKLFLKRRLKMEPTVTRLMTNRKDQFDIDEVFSSNAIQDNDMGDSETSLARMQGYVKFNGTNGDRIL